MGLLTLLDDVCNFPKGTAEKFWGKMNEHDGTHSHYGPGSIASTFVVKHYAGDVRNYQFFFSSFSFSEGGI